jgi:hypothetical protein
VTIRQAYSVLGLDPSTTTPDEIRLRFRELVRSNHPDGKPSHEQAQANERTRAIVEACSFLRAQGLLRETTRPRSAAPGGLSWRQATTAEPLIADIFGWIDELWRECLGANLGYVVSPLFGVRLALAAWEMGCEIMWGVGSNSGRSAQQRLG